MRTSICLLGILFASAFLWPIPQTAEAQEARKIQLAGYKMKPKVATSGSGFVTVKLNGDTLQVHGDFSDLVGSFSGAYIMVKIRNQGGNQLYRLKAHLNEDRTGGTFKASENKFGLSESEKALLQKGNLYITVNSFEHQRGEIGGDIGPLGK